MSLYVRERPYSVVIYIILAINDVDSNENEVDIIPL